MEEYPILRAEANDPKLADKFREFFLETYRMQSANPCEQPAATPAPPTPEAERDSPFYLDLDNLPEEHLPPEEYLFLLRARQAIRSWIARPRPPTDDAQVAAVTMTRGYILIWALHYIEVLSLYLITDSRFHPERNIRAKSINVFNMDDPERTVNRRLASVMQCALGCNLLFPELCRNVAFANELQLLHQVGDIFFDTLQSVFPIPAVGKCRRAFTLLMRDFGNWNGRGHIENYVRRRKTMYREMVAYEANGEACRPAIAEQIAELTKKIANMDRRQRTLQSHVKNTVTGFTELFSPSRSEPSREEVDAVLLPSDRYACLAGVDEPHRSELKAVIDFTLKHPISRQEEGKRGVLTLANAARSVWDDNHEKWELIPGSFENYNQLKSSCYNLAKDPATNPFNYAN